MKYAIQLHPVWQVKNLLTGKCRKLTTIEKMRVENEFPHVWLEPLQPTEVEQITSIENLP